MGCRLQVYRPVAAMNIFAAIKRSLFARLLLIFSVTAALIFLVAALIGSWLLQDQSHRRIRALRLNHYIDYVLDDLGSAPTTEKLQNIANNAPLDILFLTNDLSWQSSSEFPDLRQLSFTPMRIPGRSTTNYRGHRFFKISKPGSVIVFVSPKFANNADHTLAVVLLLISLMLILGLCYYAVRRLFRPLKLLHDGVARIGKGELAYRVANTRDDELGELTTAVNKMAEQVGGMLDSKRQLLLAISHELRSPLTRAKLASEFIESEKTKHSLLDDLNEMEDIIFQLIESERLQKSHAALQLENVDLVLLINKTIERYSVHQLDLVEFKHPPQLIMKLDAVRIELLVHNLLKNAFAHGGGLVTLVLSVEDKQMCLLVADEGPGIAAAHLDKLTEAFYRVDSARQRTSSGGYGLGLYLCGLITKAHGGELSIQSQPGQGTRVEVSLPIKEQNN